MISRALSIARDFRHIARMRPAHRAKLALGIAIGIVSLSLIPSSSRAERLSPETIAAFDRYANISEARENEELAARKNFLWIDALPQPQREQGYVELKRGQLIVRRFQPCEEHCTTIPDALIHDWVGIVFVPGVSLADTLAAIQDYDRDTNYYRPQVVEAKLLAKAGNDFRVFLRLKQTHVMTVVLDTEYEIQYRTLDVRHAVSRSHSTKIEEV